MQNLDKITEASVSAGKETGQTIVDSLGGMFKGQVLF